MKHNILIQIIGPAGPFGKTATAATIKRHLEQLGHTVSLQDGPSELKRHFEPGPPEKVIPMKFSIQVISVEMPVQDEQVAMGTIYKQGGVSWANKATKPTPDYPHSISLERLQNTPDQGGIWKYDAVIWDPVDEVFFSISEVNLNTEKGHNGWSRSSKGRRNIRELFEAFSKTCHCPSVRSRVRFFIWEPKVEATPVAKEIHPSEYSGRAEPMKAIKCGGDYVTIKDQDRSIDIRMDHVSSIQTVWDSIDGVKRQSSIIELMAGGVISLGHEGTKTFLPLWEKFKQN